MANYIVVFDEESDENGRRIAEFYPSAYEHHPKIFFVRSDEVSEAVASRLRIKGENRDINGAVFRVSSAYSGYTRKSLWEWLDVDNPNIKLVTSSNREVGPNYGGGGRTRDDLPKRVASLETGLKHFATKTWILSSVILVIFSVVSTVGAGVWYLSGRLTTIETRIIAVEASFDSYKEFHNGEHDREYSSSTED